MRAAAGRALPPVPVDLTRRGFEAVRAMEGEQAKSIAGRLTPGEGIVFLDRADLGYVEGILAPALDGIVGDHIRGHFRSEFAVLGLAFRRKVAGRTGRNADGNENYEKGSAYWHCDAGPVEHLKLLVYLSALDDHDGGTIFIDRSTTDLLKRVGTVFQPVADRQLDIRPVAQSHGFELEESLLRPDLGEAVLFQPANVLHRARIPDRGERITMTLLLLPSANPWREPLRTSLDFALANHACAFPRLPARVEIKS
jgi:hypothetical protein